MIELIVIEHQSSHFNALAGVLILLFRVRKGGMWRSSRTAVIQRIITLNQRHLIGALTILIVPFVLLDGTDRERLAPPIRIYTSDSNQVVVWNRECIGNAKRVLEYRLDWTPDLGCGQSA